MSAAVAVKTPAGMDQVRKACAFIQQHADAPITLARLARHVNASPFHFQRVFTRLVGISPRAYQDALRAGRFRRGLREGVPVTGAIYDAGYGSSSRVYERLPTGRGMTPAVYKRGAQWRRGDVCDRGFTARPSARRGDAEGHLLGEAWRQG